MLVKNGWTIFAHEVLLDQVEALKARIEAHPKDPGPRKVLAWLTDAMFEKIPSDPTLATYRQGKTLGDGFKHWFRDKYKGRFRLFFRYDSTCKAIVFAWVNDEQTLRTRGRKNDAYAVFAGMLLKGNPPDDWDALMSSASSKATVERARSIFFNR